MIMGHARDDQERRKIMADEHLQEARAVLRGAGSTRWAQPEQSMTAIALTLLGLVERIHWVEQYLDEINRTLDSINHAVREQ